MKRKQIQQLRDRTIADLRKELATRETLREKLMEDLASGKVKNVRAIQAFKKDIAQILTVLNEKSRTDNMLSNKKKSV